MEGFDKNYVGRLKDKCANENCNVHGLEYQNPKWEIAKQQNSAQKSENGTFGKNNFNSEKKKSFNHCRGSNASEKVICLLLSVSD